MAKFSSGKFTPKYMHKYIGKKLPIWRSSWEFRIMAFLDSNKSILYWASESIRIPYRNPLTGKITSYVPDFFVVYQNKNGKKIAEIIEVKPKKQTSLLEAKTSQDKAHAIVNMAKFAAANLYCKQYGYTFRVLSEDSIFYQGKTK